MFLSQTFDLTDIPRVAALTFLEIILSADNAVVLGLLVHSLPPVARRKALSIGIFSAFILRAIALLAISILLTHPWLQLLGAAYLVYLAIQHFFKTPKEQLVPTARSFWKTVLLIELFDLAFAIDSIVAGFAFIASGFPSEAPIHPKLWIVYVGGILGLTSIRYAANLFAGLIGKFPRLETSAYLMIGWIGLKLAVSALTPAISSSLEPIFWAILALFFLTGFIKRRID